MTQLGERSVLSGLWVIVLMGMTLRASAEDNRLDLDRAAFEKLARAELSQQLELPEFLAPTPIQTHPEQKVPGAGIPKDQPQKIPTQTPGKTPGQSQSGPPGWAPFLGSGEIWVQDWVSAVGWPSAFTQSFIAYVLPQTREQLVGTELVAAYWIRLNADPTAWDDPANPGSMNPGVVRWLRNVGTTSTPRWWPVHSDRLLVSGDPAELTALQAGTLGAFPGLEYDLVTRSRLLTISEILPKQWSTLIHWIERFQQAGHLVTLSLNDVLVHQPNRMADALRVSSGASDVCLVSAMSASQAVWSENPDSCFRGGLGLPLSLRGSQACALDLPICH